MKLISGGVCAAQGFKANGIHCGIRRNHSKKDLALIVSQVPAAAAAVYTTNLVKGAPLTVTKNNIANGMAQAVICNSGNANTCNWNGIEIAEGMCKLVEQHTGIAASDVVVASTGVIGQVLDLTPIAGGMEDIKNLYKSCYANGLVKFTEATDPDGMLSAAAFSGRDDMTVSVYGNDERILLVSRFDNLGKGASGAAIQNMNLILGIDESTGLNV